MKKALKFLPLALFALMLFFDLPDRDRICFPFIIQLAIAIMPFARIRKGA